MTGVDDSCFSQTGESYSMIAMPNADSHNARVLQEDNTELAYECPLPRLEPRHANHASPCALASKQSRASFRATPPRVRAAIEPRACTHTPYQPTHAHSFLRADLDTKGIHEVAARRFCLVAAGAPWPNHCSGNSKAHHCALFFVQTTLWFPLLVRTRRSSSAPHGSNPNPRRLTTVVATRAHPCPCLRRMGEISMCAASHASP